MLPLISFFIFKVLYILYGYIYFIRKHESPQKNETKCYKTPECAEQSGRKRVRCKIISVLHVQYYTSKSHLFC